MKNSGVEWIGEIPEEWKIFKLKYLGRYINGYAFKPEDWESEGLPIIRIQDLTSDNDNPNYYKGLLNDDYLINYGDILVSWAATLDAFIWNKEKGWLNQHIFKAEPFLDIIKKQYFYWLIKEAMKNMNNDNKHGIVMQHVTLGVFNNFEVAIPPLNIQQIISDYLDSKCNKIEETIQNQQQVIEKLKAYKQSLITEAVTGKIKIQNEIPDFKYCNLGFIAEFKNGLNYNASDFGTEIKFLGVGDFQNYLVLNDESMFSNIITDTEIEDDYYLKNGDIIFVRSNGSKELVGRAIMVDNIDFKVTYSGFCIRLRNKEPQKINSKFLLYFFRSDYFRSELQRLSQGSNISNINQDLLSHIKIPLVDMSFQNYVVSYLDKKCTAIDIAIEQKQKLIVKLTEYKKSLIYECVTGKKEI